MKFVRTLTETVENIDFKIFAIFLLIFAVSCSVPNLENIDCTDARNSVKQLYSFHLGNEMTPTLENLALRKKYLTSELASQLQNLSSGKRDYFTQTDDYPKAFRVGECAIVDAGTKVNVQVVIFWKNDTRNEQKELQIEAVKRGQDWLINKVEEYK